MSHAAAAPRKLDPAKFLDPERTAKGEARAQVALGRIATLWFNTGTLCNLTCPHCYIESSPANDRLVYLSAAEVAGFLDQLPPEPIEIGFTGGEPFMNPDLPAMLTDALGRGHRGLVLTNAMKPMTKRARELDGLIARFGRKLAVRVSLDHYGPALHDLERGARGFAKSLAGLEWLAARGCTIAVAGRRLWGESEPQLRAGYARLFAERGLAIDAADPAQLVLFPEMDAGLDVPEITTACWGILGKRPEAMMCASSRMVVRHKGDARPTVMPCTLLPYDRRFALGATLAEASGDVALNHPHCARFCVLGGGSCGG
ncbi:MAG: radical SAM protein [Alphaproteobacteria bacterium]|nr:radical SAM protein [Alphaproteobacteria bacterium]